MYELLSLDRDHEWLEFRKSYLSIMPRETGDLLVDISVQTGNKVMLVFTQNSL